MLNDKWILKEVIDKDEIIRMKRKVVDMKKDEEMRKQKLKRKEDR